MRLYLISALLIAFLAILFALQNTNLVTIQFFIWEYRQPLALVLLGTLAIGVIVGLLVSVPAVVRRNLRAARMKSQADSLTQLVHEKDEAITTESQKANTVKQNYEELLKLLGVVEPITGLIRQELLPRAIATQLQLFQSQGEIARLPALNILLFKVLPVLEADYPLEATFGQIAQILQQQAAPKTWFFSNGQGIFAATTSGLDMKALTQYGERLQAAILQHPPVLPSGKGVEWDVTVGGAIADTPATLDSHTLVQTAETALEQALQRGRNRVRILHAS